MVVVLRVIVIDVVVRIMEKVGIGSSVLMILKKK